MKKTAYGILAAILLTLLPARAQAAQPITLYFVQPVGEVFTVEEQTRAQTALDAAAAWWGDRTGVSLAVRATAAITLTEPAFPALLWARPLLPYPPEGIIVFVLDNSTSRALIGDDSYGEAQHALQAAWVVLDGYTAEDELAATLAHELGHVLYDLPHAPSPCAGDIMCSPSPAAAYRAGTLGAHTTAALYGPVLAVSTSLPHGGKVGVWASVRGYTSARLTVPPGWQLETFGQSLGGSVREDAGALRWEGGGESVSFWAVYVLPPVAVRGAYAVELCAPERCVASEPITWGLPPDLWFPRVFR